MAETIEGIAESLLSQQAADRAKADKRRRKDERVQKALGVLVAGQGIVNSALKRRSQEIKDAGTISKQRSKIQAQNFNKLTPIFKELEPYGVSGYDQFEKDFTANPEKFNKLKMHLDPFTNAIIDNRVGVKDMDPRQRAATFNQLQNEVVLEVARGALPLTEQFNKGISAMAEDIKIDKESMFDYFTGIDVNDLDGYKAQKVNERVKSYGNSIFGGGAWRGLGNALTFGLIKEQKGQPNPFKKIEEDWKPLNADVRKVFNTFNVNKTITDTVSSNFAAMRNFEAEFESNPDYKQRMEIVFDGTFDRINNKSGLLRQIFAPATTGDRFSKFKEHRIDDLIDDINSNTAVKAQLLKSAGGVSQRLADPSNSSFRNTFIDAYIKEFNIEEGSAQYQQLLQGIQTLGVRDELAMDFVLSQVVTDKYQGNPFDDIADFLNPISEPFTYDFSKIDALVKPAFQLTKDKKGFEPTGVYRNSELPVKKQLYESYLKGILSNATNSSLSQSELRLTANAFMDSVPYPGDENPATVLQRIIDGIQPESNVPLFFESAVQPRL